ARDYSKRRIWVYPFVDGACSQRAELRERCSWHATKTRMDLASLGGQRNQVDLFRSTGFVSLVNANAPRYAASWNRRNVLRGHHSADEALGVIRLTRRSRIFLVFQP